MIAPLARRAARYPFPDHWSFFLGELALYAFVVLVATGVYLTFFFDPSSGRVVYDGVYAPLRGSQMTEAYRSVVDISFQVKAGLLVRQTHHWAANVFVAAIALHLGRILLTGAFRRPRRLTYLLGLALLALALLEGFLGYSLVDDLLSGMGLAIAYSVVASLPLVGGNLALLLWGAPFPGTQAVWPRMYVTHVLLIPLAIGALLVAHLALVAARKHTQLRGPGRSERVVVGLRAFPAYAPRTLAVAFAVAAVLVLLGGLVQINPVWLWGPFHTALSTNGAQPDWYLGWMIGALRLLPGLDVVVAGKTLVPSPFWGGVALPFLLFAGLAAWPWLHARLTGDRAPHNLLDRPRDAPGRAGAVAALATLVAVLLLAGGADRIALAFRVPYPTLLWVFRALLVAAPVAAFLLVRTVCRQLAAPGTDRRRPAGAIRPP